MAMSSSITAVSRLVHLTPSISNPKPFLSPKPLFTLFSLKSSSYSPILSSSSLNSSSSSSSSAAAANSSITMSYDKQLVAAKKAASLAARLCQNVQKGLLQSDVHSKSDKSPVTVADYGSQVLVSFVLQKELPDQAFSLVAEEDSGDLRKEESQETLQRITKLVNDTIANDGSYKVSPLSEGDVLTIIDSGMSEGGPNGQHWVLDPIDGTKGFLRGDQYAIALGLLDEGKVVLGVLACPNLPLESIASANQTALNKASAGCLFSAQLSCGTYMESLDGSPPVKVHVSNTENPEEASFFESYEAAHSSHSLSGSIAKKLGVKAPPVRIDSQAKYGALSRGDGAIYLRFPNKGYREKIWDHAAGYIVVAEAGGVATDAAGEPLDFSKGRYLDLDTGIIVTNRKLMPALLKAVQDSLKEEVLPSL
ncbi:putative phosphoric monoester hydrolase [Helianthus annuus]|uniref:Phosphoric monoester hydrolase n=1 Tax=Helianthus annuus TaxID=4232 RepID=A0A251TXT4_HELAN|nr:SAL1 phosphatase [Helianthus annuus]KAF5791152.1 putative phosphoric monoester hydrolase [Helianthus annuus]KAJ0534663.1 putative phosphoric monoester hydrolase [Helianthus annuus]KAJ0542660.1 putative phosphoric monoester hydrolase [Helianthus annuus]KAJ0888544.1 putative phosphoric monoester hydrolase [Helianthus annuus]